MSNLNYNYIEKELKNHMNEIEKYGVKELGVFGSILNGTATEKSDLDILVSFDNSHNLYHAYFDLKFFLEDLFKIKVDLCIKSNLKKGIKENILASVKYVKTLEN